MLKLLIVDDEPMFREGIFKTVDWNSMGVQVVGEAFDGKDALRILERSEVDIVLTDIRMPVMDGLELIRIAAKTLPNLRFIALSAYDDFHQVKQAFQLGIVDYILKTDFCEAELRSVLIKQQALLDASQSGIGPRQKAYAELNRRTLLGEFLRRCIDNRLSTKDRLELDGEEPLCSVVLRFHQLNTTIVPTLHGRHDMRLRKIVDSCISGEQNWCSFWEDSQLVLFFLTHETVDWRALYDETESLRARVEETLSSRFNGVSVTAGLSSVRTGAYPHRMRNEALKACEYSYFRGIGRTISINHYQNGRKDPDINLESLHAEFTTLLNMRNIERLDTRLQEFCVEPQRCNASQINAVRELYTRYYYQLLAFASQEMSHVDTHVASLLQAFPIMEAAQAPLAHTNSWLKETVSKIRASLHDSLSLSKRVTAYLHEHYKQDLSLSEVATKFSVNPSYLSRIFSKEVGTGFSQFLNEVRIQQSLHLMKTSSLRVYEIAYEVGYPNPESFSRNFKRVMGQSPKDYVR